MFLKFKFRCQVIVVKNLTAKPAAAVKQGHLKREARVYVSCIYIYILFAVIYFFFVCLPQAARSKVKTAPGDRTGATADDARSSTDASPGPEVIAVKAKPDAGMARIMMKRAELRKMEVG